MIVPSFDPPMEVIDEGDHLHMLVIDTSIAGGECFFPGD
jgi:hypothetical protein